MFLTLTTKKKFSIATKNFRMNLSAGKKEAELEIQQERQVGN